MAYNSESRVSRQIIALGGGGFSTQSEPRLDEYILRQSLEDRLEPGFIGTASGDSESYLLKFYSRFSKLNCAPSHLELFRRTPDIADWTRQQDIIFVGGGNTKSMLALWADWELPRQLQLALERGVILSGISAGAICWFESGVTDSFAGDLRLIKGLGILSGSCCPHYSGEADRKLAYRHMVERGEVAPGIAIDDGACVHFVDGAPLRVISGLADANAYSVFAQDGAPAEVTILDVERLDVAV